MYVLMKVCLTMRQTTHVPCLPLDAVMPCLQRVCCRATQTLSGTCSLREDQASHCSRRAILGTNGNPPNPPKAHTQPDQCCNQPLFYSSFTASDFETPTTAILD